MLRILQAFVCFLISVALVFPIAYTTGDWHLSIFVSLIVTSCYWFQYSRSKNLFGSFLNGVLMGVLASLCIWILNFIDVDEALKHNYLFVGSFFILFCIFSALTFCEVKKVYLRLPLIIVNALALVGLVLFLIFTNQGRHKIGWILLFGSLIGIIFGSLLTVIFQRFFKVGLKVFSKIWHYIEVLLKPALIFFTGYLTIGLLYAGIYNLIFRFSPQAFTFPKDQLAFIDFILYAIDTMTTGGDSAVQAVSILAQLINTLNVFTAIIWMTIILAATIGHSSEKFQEVAARHRKASKKNSKKTTSFS